MSIVHIMYSTVVLDTTSIFVKIKLILIRYMYVRTYVGSVSRYGTWHWDYVLYVAVAKWPLVLLLHTYTLAFQS